MLCGGLEIARVDFIWTFLGTCNKRKTLSSEDRIQTQQNVFLLHNNEVFSSFRTTPEDIVVRILTNYNGSILHSQGRQWQCDLSIANRPPAACVVCVRGAAVRLKIKFKRVRSARPPPLAPSVGDHVVVLVFSLQVPRFGRHSPTHHPPTTRQLIIPVALRDTYDVGQ